ncbi:hypothetical protein DFQ26_008704 [Actinomortierella ambigua]|nr:hypothetical protein DFQ26_008704 [Actinomortierella ambigua]
MTATATDAHAPATNGAESKVNHSEVAFIFVQEYYTFMNKDPHRLHCFYAKDSAMVHGNEGEVTTPLHGQQAIHSKILDLDFQDCKVHVKNVDALSSLDGGIIIQVLGEMANKAGPCRKFSQTFFLAQQPKGYYVLNDIFRFIKDDDTYEEGDEEESQEEEVAHEAEPEVPASEAPAPVAEEPAHVEAVAAAHEEPVVPASETKPEPVKEEAPEAAPVAVAPEATEEKKTEKKTEKRAGDKKTGDKKAEKKEEVKKEEDAEKTAMATAIPEAPVDIPAPTPAPAPAEPAKPKTWANLAANNSSHWGSQASTTKGASVTVSQPPSKPATPAPSSSQQAQQPQQSQQPQQQQQQPQQTQQQHSQPRPHREFHSIYVKNVTEKMSLDQLREAFSQFGVVKHLELTGKRNCAFVDFATAEAVQAALKQNTVKVGHETVLAEERRRLGGGGSSGGPQGGRPFHHHHNHQNGANGHVNGHRYDAKQGGPQGGAGRGGRGGSARGGPGDRKSFHRQENKPVPAAAAK